MCWTVDSVQTIIFVTRDQHYISRNAVKVWQIDFMKSTIRSNFASALLTVSLAIAINPVGAFAQGSAGGSIGNDDKAVSGSRQERAVDREKPAAREQGARRSRHVDEPREPTPRKSGGGGGSFDGAWTVVSVGVTCSDSLTEAVVVTSGRIVGPNGTGTVSSSGSVSGLGNYSGITVTSQGRMVGRNGSGTFQRSDGCTGRWTSSKQ
jgi:hypothetical protein